MRAKRLRICDPIRKCADVIRYYGQRNSTRVTRLQPRRKKKSRQQLQEIAKLKILVRAVICLVLLLLAPSVGRVRAADSEGSDTADQFIALFSFVGGTALTESERQRVEAETASQLRSDQAGVASSEAKVRKFLASLPRAEGRERASQRESMRYQVELLPASDPARQIVERHDPTVLFDRAKQHLIAEGTLAAWQRACVWLTNYLSAPAPRPDFITTQRADLKAHFASLPSDKHDAIAHVERDFPVGVLLLDRADSEQREAFTVKRGPKLSTSRNSASALRMRWRKHTTSRCSEKSSIRASCSTPVLIITAYTMPA